MAGVFPAFLKASRTGKGVGVGKGGEAPEKGGGGLL